MRTTRRLPGMPKVLLVEDHDLVLRTLCDVIHDAGYQADCVKTQAAALAALAPGSHSLVIVDVMLPDGSGYDVAEKANQLGIKTVMMTGHVDEIHSLATSGARFLEKPFQMAEFTRMIRQEVCPDSGADTLPQS